MDSGLGGSAPEGNDSWGDALMSIRAAMSWRKRTVGTGPRGAVGIRITGRVEGVRELRARRKVAGLDNEG